VLVLASNGGAVSITPSDTYQLINNGNVVDLVCSSVNCNNGSLLGLLPSGSGGNSQNVAAAIDAYAADPPLPPSFLPLYSLTPSQLVYAMSQLDGEAASDAPRGAFNLMNDFLGLILDPFVDGRDGIGSQGVNSNAFSAEQASFPPEIALAYAGVLKAPPKPAAFDQRWTAWGSSFGGSSKLNGNPVTGSNNVTASAYGFAGGMDYHYSRDTIIGFALAGGGTSWGLAQALGGGRSDSFQAGAYGITRNGPAYLAADLAFANHWMTTDRIAFAGDRLTARFSAQSYGGRVEAGYRYAMPEIGVTPYGALQVQSFHAPGYSETDLTGVGFGLSYNAVAATDARSELGARFDDTTLLNGTPLTLRARAAWAHDWVSNPSLEATFEALPGASFIVSGAAPPKNSALASVGADMHLTANWSVLTKFDGEFASGSRTYAGSATLRYTW